MFKIQDGRKSFTQWDLNRKIIVEDDSIVKVHFTNLLNKTALVSEVKNHLADVPNVLLQDYGTILIYGYDGNYTKYVEAFRVVRKEKPEDYIYTETEVLNYNNLLERMNNIEGSIEQVVTDYLRENPPKVDLDGYATKEYVDNAIAAISAVDLSDYFTKEEANAKFATKEEIPSTSGLATEEFVNGKVSGLASESYVDDAVAAIPQPDLSGYALKSEIPSTVGLATEQYVNEAVSNVRVDLTGYATEEYVDNAVAGIEIPEEIKHITITDVNELLDLETGLYIVDNNFTVEAIQGETYLGEIQTGMTTLTGMMFVGQYYDYSFFNGELLYDEESETSIKWYYNWNVSGNNYINLESRFNIFQNAGYQTEEQVSAAISKAVAAIEIPEVDLSGYQEKLTAGDNITIEGNVISATGGGSGGSVSVDGTTIIQNDDGTISTAFGKGYMYVDSDSLIRADNTLNATPSKSIIFGSGNKVYSSTWGKLSNSVVIGNNNFFSGGSMASNSIYLGSNNTVMNVGGILAGDSCTMTVGTDIYNPTPCIMVGANLQSAKQNPYALFGKNGNLQNNQMLAVAYGSSELDAPIFSVDTSGNVNANGTISGGGSDYAEFFEWQDGNPEEEDRVGLIVALRGDKIVLAQDGDDVLGIVSGTATVLGDNAEYTWSKIHLRDDFGRLIYEDAVFENEDGITYTEKHPKKNPDYNPEEKYIARSKRKEWDVVGMLGKLYVRDDGTCGAGGYAKVGADGIATLSQEPTNMYVMKRTAANIVRVLFK